MNNNITALRQNTNTPLFYKKTNLNKTKQQILETFSKTIFSESWNNCQNSPSLKIAFGFDYVPFKSVSLFAINEEEIMTLSRNKKHNWFTTHILNANKNITKSSIDMAATIFIKENFADAFINDKFNTRGFKAFLKDKLLENINIDHIDNKYCNNIKYDIANNQIIFNNYTYKLDNNNYLKTPLKTQGMISNQFIRNTYNNDFIKYSKKYAITYIENLKIKINELPKKEQEILIKQIIWFYKILNGCQRNLSKYKANFEYLRHLVTPIFIALKITINKNNTIESVKEQQNEFINVALIINFRRNKGQLAKQFFIKTPIISLSIGALIYSFCFNFIGYFNEITIVLLIIGIYETFRAIKEAMDETAAQINAGDRLNSYTSSFNKTMNILIRNINEDSNKYKNDTLWKEVPKMCNITNLFRENDISLLEINTLSKKIMLIFENPYHQDIRDIEFIELM